MSPAIPEEKALASALRAQAGAATDVFVQGGATARARARSAWWAVAARCGALVDAAIHAARPRLDCAAPERTCADVWLRIVCDDTIQRGDCTRDAASALSPILAACLPQAEALARVRLDARTPPVVYNDVRRRLAYLCEALGEDLATWHLPLARVAALAALPQSVWRGLERAPPWAVVRALDNTTAPDDDYRHAVETLLRSAVAWAVPPVANAARDARITLARAPDPVRLDSVLSQWTWRHVEPPLASVAAFGDTACTHIDHDVWAAAIMLDRDGHGDGLLTAEQRVQAIQRDASNLRTRLDAAIERQACSLVEEWLTFLDPPSRSYSYMVDVNARARGALTQMRTLWMSDPRLTWHGSNPDALRLESYAPDPHRSDADACLHDARRRGHYLVWRVSCTDPARAIVYSGSVPGLPQAHAQPASLELYLLTPDDPIAHTGPPDRLHTAQTDRSAAVHAILECVAERWCISRSSETVLF